MKHIHLILYSLLALVVVLLLAWLLFVPKHTQVELSADSEAIDVTPQLVAQVKQIGQWEMLAVAQEELVDTTRRGLFSDDHLARIYYGTMRLGVDLHQCQPGWLTVVGDSLSVILPPVSLLDRDFIDEARTRSFYESGRWSAADREALYRRAYQRMLSRGMAPHNMQAARQQAEAQFRQLFAQMGYTRVHITFADQ